MLKVRTALAGVLAGVALGSAAPAAHAAQPLPVRVSFEDGVLRVGSGVPGQPLLGASADTKTGRVCAGFSYQMPACVKVGPIS